MTTAAIPQLGIGRALWPMAGALAFSIIVIGAITRSGGVVVFTCLLSTFVIGWVTYTLLKAKTLALQTGDVPIWGGLIRLIAWNPNEGVLFLKNKQISYVDSNPNDGGGIRVIFPLLGEELVLRVPLEIQTTTFIDNGVLTREYIPLTIRGTMYWRVMDLQPFYLLVSKEIDRVSDRGLDTCERRRDQAQLESAKHWLQFMAEERTRVIISNTGTGFLIADRLASDLVKSDADSAALLAPQASQNYRTATDTLADSVKSEFDAAVRQYGLEMHRVALQEVQLPSEVYAAASEACKSAYEPLKAKAQAIANKLRLQAEVDVLGKDSVGLKEIAGNIPALAFQEFLAPLFMEYNARRASAQA